VAIENEGKDNFYHLSFNKVEKIDIIMLRTDWNAKLLNLKQVIGEITLKSESQELIEGCNSRLKRK
jgi:hypothetical protein